MPRKVISPRRVVLGARQAVPTCYFPDRMAECC